MSRKSEMILPFLTSSVLERWLLANETDEICFIIEEIILLYKSFDIIKRKHLDHPSMLILINQIIIKLNLKDNNINLNVLKFLNSIAEDFSLLLLDKSILIFQKLKVYLEDADRILRNTTLSLAITLCIKCSFRTVSHDIVYMIETSCQIHFEASMKIASTSLLNFLLTAKKNKDENLSANNDTTNFSYLIRIATVAIKKMIHSNKNETLKNHIGVNDHDFQLKFQSTIDLLSIASISYEVMMRNMEKATIKERSIYDHSDNVAVSGNKLLYIMKPSLLFKELEASILSREELTNNLDPRIERDVCRRIITLEFPSLFEDSLKCSLLKSLLSEIKCYRVDVTAGENAFSENVITDSSIVKESSASVNPSIQNNNSINYSFNKLRNNSNSDKFEGKLINLNATSNYEGKNSNTLNSNDTTDSSVHDPFTLSGNSSMLTGTTTTYQETSVDSEENDPMRKSLQRIKKPGVRIMRPRTGHAAYTNDTELESQSHVINNFEHNMNDKSFDNELTLTSSPNTPNQSFGSISRARSRRSRLNGVNRKDFDVDVNSCCLDQNQQEESFGINLTSSFSKALNVSTDCLDDHTENHSYEDSHLYSTSLQSSPRITVDEPNKLIIRVKQSLPNENITLSQGSKNSPRSPRLDSEIKSDVFEYLDSEYIKPLQTPVKDFKKILKGLEVQEWPEIFYTLNNLRALALHHPSVLIDSNSITSLHNLVLLTMKRVDDLRSSLAKNAIISIGDIIKGLGKHMDSEVLTILPGLLKRSSDSSIFLVESADKVLQILLENLSLSRSLPGLLSHCSHRSPILRKKVAKFLLTITITKSDELFLSKDLELFRNCLLKLIQDSTPEARAYSRETVKILMEKRIILRNEFEGSLSSDLLDKIQCQPSVDVLNIYSPSPATISSSSHHHHCISNHDEYCDYKASPIPCTKRTPNERTRTFSNHEELSADTLHSDRVTMNSRSSRELQNLIKSTDKMYQALDQVSSKSFSISVSSSPSKKDVPGYLQESIDQCSSALTPIRKLPPSSYSHAHNTHNNIHISPSSNKSDLTNTIKAKRILEEDPQLSKLQEILNSTTVKSWLDRNTGLDILTTMVIQHYIILKDGNRLSVCLDHILNRLKDGMVKVHMHALHCLNEIYDHQPLILQNQFLQIIAPALLNSIASSNKPISMKSSELLKKLFDTIPPTQVAQYLCQTSLYEKDKLRCIAIKFLTDCMFLFCVETENIVSIVKRIIFPVIRKILFNSTTKSDLRVASVDCIRSMQSSLKTEKVWLWSDEPVQQEEIKRFTSQRESYS